MRARVPTIGGLAWSLAALVGTAVALAGPLLVSPGHAAGHLTAAASGAIRITDSRADEAVLAASNLAPAEPVSGMVTIGNDGSAPAALSLSLGALAEEAGRGGGTLSGLRLIVRDVTRGSEAVVYRGPLEAMPRLELGVLGAGAQRRYSFQAVLLAGEGTVTDNAGQGSRTSFAFAWGLDTASGRPCQTRLPGGVRPNLLLGSEGGDRLTGYLGDDEISGGDGGDCVGGGPGADRLWGGGGADRVRGGPGNDSIVGGSGRDRLSGGSGDDVIDARDGFPDRVDCGPGRDRAIVDAFDRVRPGTCEVVEVAP